MENPTNYGDKKPQGLRPINRNPLFEIKSYRFIDLLSITYNLIHIYGTTTTRCSLVDILVPPKGLWSSTNNSNDRILE